MEMVGNRCDPYATMKSYSLRTSAVGLPCRSAANLHVMLGAAYSLSSEAIPHSSPKVPHRKIAGRNIAYNSEVVNREGWVRAGERIHYPIIMRV